MGTSWYSLCVNFVFQDVIKRRKGCLVHPSQTSLRLHKAANPAQHFPLSLWIDGCQATPKKVCMPASLQAFFGWLIRSHVCAHDQMIPSSPALRCLHLKGRWGYTALLSVFIYVNGNAKRRSLKWELKLFWTPDDSVEFPNLLPGQRTASGTWTHIEASSLWSHLFLSLPTFM